MVGKVFVEFFLFVWLVVDFYVYFCYVGWSFDFCVFYFEVLLRLVKWLFWRCIVCDIGFVYNRYDGNILNVGGWIVVKCWCFLSCYVIRLKVSFGFEWWWYGYGWCYVWFLEG